MAAPRDIVDALECVLSVYFSGVRHNLRAAFILCDGLVELTCKAKAQAAHPSLGHIGFVPLLKLPAVAMNHDTHPIGRKAYASHLLRNSMHHANSAATVDTQRCADAIIGAVECIEHCFPGARANLQDKIKVALRVVQVFSAHGSGAHQTAFQDGMMRHTWRTGKGAARVSETVIAPGMRRNWSIVIMDAVADIETILNNIGAP